jgi:hypothetical protein
VLVELLAHFDRQRGDVHVVEVGRQLQVFVVLLAADLVGLAVDIAGVLDWISTCSRTGPSSIPGRPGLAFAPVRLIRLS